MTDRPTEGVTPENIAPTHPAVAHSRTPDFIGPRFELKEASGPAIAKNLTFDRFLALARSAPHLHARNTCGFVDDALASFGTRKGIENGREVTIFNVMEGVDPFNEGVASQAPVDQEEAINEFHLALREQARLPIPNKGILLWGEPGCGKNTVIDMLLQSAQNYSRYNEMGVRYRIAIRVKKDEMGIRPNTGDVVEEFHGNSNVYASASNASPFSVLNYEIDVLRRYDRHISANECKQYRTEIIQSLSDRLRQLGHTEPLNEGYILTSNMGFGLKSMYDALLANYLGEKERKGNGSPININDVKEAIELIRKKHIIAQPYYFDMETGEGILVRKPQGDTGSGAWSLDDYTHHTPSDLQSGQRPPISYSSATLLADVTHLEDLLNPGDVHHPGLDLPQLLYLRSLIEKGELQIPTLDPYASSPRSLRYMLVRGKDGLTIASANTVNLHQRMDQEGYTPLIGERFIGIPIYHITNYKKQAEKLNASLSSLNDRLITRHTVEIAALFFTATRLIDPKPEEYLDAGYTRADDAVKALRGGVKKALYLALSKDDPITASDLGITEPKDLAYLLRRSVRNKIGHEYRPTRGLPIDNNLTDGGFGISPRVAEAYFGQMIAKVTDRAMTVRDVIEQLKKEDGRFQYYRVLSEIRKRMQQKLFVQICEEQELKPISPSEFDDSDDALALQEAWDESEQKTKEKFPIATPKQIIDDLETHAKRLVKRDVMAALGVEEANTTRRFIQYLHHAGAYAVRGLQVPEKYRVLKSTAQPNDQYNEHGVSETFMRSVEEELQISETNKDKHRSTIWLAFSTGIQDLQKEAVEKGLPLPDAKDEQIIEAVIERKEELREKSTHLLRHATAIAARKLVGFVSDLGQYAGQPEILDKAVRERVQGAEEYKLAWEYLLKNGYNSEQVLPGLIHWATAPLPTIIGPEKRK